MTKNGFLKSMDPSSILLHFLLPAAAANRRRPYRFAQTALGAAAQGTRAATHASCTSAPNNREIKRSESQETGNGRSDQGWNAARGEGLGVRNLQCSKQVWAMPIRIPVAGHNGIAGRGLQNQCATERVCQETGQPNQRMPYRFCGGGKPSTAAIAEWLRNGGWGQWK